MTFVWSSPPIPLAWTPAQLGAAVVAWWDVTDTATVTQSGGVITALADKSGNGFTLSTLAGSVAYNGTAINGHPAFVLDGTNEMGTATTLLLSQPFTVATLFRTGSASVVGNYETIWDGDINGLASNRAIEFQNRPDFADEPTLYAGTNVSLNASTLLTSTTYLSVSQLNGASSSQGYNGATPTTINTGTNGIVNGMGFAGIGSRGFFIVINRTISTTERQNLEGYINSRFA